jgi:hypothetical protein
LSEVLKVFVGGMGLLTERALVEEAHPELLPMIDAATRHAEARHILLL